MSGKGWEEGTGRKGGIERRDGDQDPNGKERVNKGPRNQRKG